ncbi:hypothetical protein QJQ45_023750 [Haematococcus lacustris]|nr:hypothetical protein QJQ45_023750 [Haematococcus lacustris]
MSSMSRISLLGLALSRRGASTLRRLIRLAWRVLADVRWLLKLIGRPLRTAGIALCAAELAFWLFFSAARRRLTRLPDEHRPSELDGQLVFQRVLDFVKTFNSKSELTGKFQAHIQTWFLGAPWHTVRRGNLEDHIAHSFYYTTRDAMLAEGHGELLSEMVDRLQASFKLESVPDGYNPHLKAMWHLHQPVRVQYRPLTFYLCMEACAAISWSAMRLMGFRQGSAGGLTFWFTPDLTLTPATARDTAQQLVPAATPQLHQLLQAQLAGVMASTASSQDVGSVADTYLAVTGLADVAASLPRTPLPQALKCDASETEGAEGALEQTRVGAPLGPAASAEGQQQGQGGRGGQGQGQLQGQGGREGQGRQQGQGAVEGQGGRTLLQSVGGSALSADSRHCRSGGVEGQQQQGQGTGGGGRDQAAGLTSSTRPPASCLPESSISHSSLEAEDVVQGVGSAPQGPGGGRLLLAPPLSGPGAAAAPPAPPAPPPLTPIVFLHGVGVGLLTYLQILLRMRRTAAARAQPLVVLEFPWVGMRLSHEVPTADQVALAMVHIMDRLGVAKASVVAHSYGSFVASRLAQLHGARVDRMVLIDPVCLGMFMPQLLHTFLYASPRRDSLWHWVKDVFMRLIARELHVATTFCRRFYWTDVQLEPSQLPPHSLVVVGGQDELLHGEEVAHAVHLEAQSRSAASAAQLLALTSPASPPASPSSSAPPHTLPRPPTGPATMLVSGAEQGGGEVACLPGDGGVGPASTQLLYYPDMGHADIVFKYRVQTKGRAQAAK